jgi:hypothetical protein
MWESQTYVKSVNEFLDGIAVASQPYGSWRHVLAPSLSRPNAMYSILTGDDDLE